MSSSVSSYQTSVEDVELDGLKMLRAQDNSNTEPSSQCVPSSETGEEPPIRRRPASKFTNGLDVMASASSDTSEEEPFIRRRQPGRKIDTPATILSDTSDEEPFIRRHRWSAKKIDISAAMPSDTSEEEPLIRRRRRAARNTAVEYKTPAHVFSPSVDQEPLARRRSKRKSNADTSTLVPADNSDEQPMKRLRRSMRVKPSVDYRELPRGFYSESAPSVADLASQELKSVTIPSNDTDEEPFIPRRHRQDSSSSSTIVDSTLDFNLEEDQAPGTGSSSGIDHSSTLNSTSIGDYTGGGDSEYDSDRTIPENHLPETTNHVSSTSRRKTEPQLLCNLPPQIFELIQFIPPESIIRSRDGPYLHESVRHAVVNFCHGSLSASTRDTIAGLLILMPEDLLQNLAQTIEYIVRWCCDAKPGLYGLEHILEGRDGHKRVVRWLRKAPNKEIAAAMGIEITGQQIIRLLMDRIELLARPALSHQFALLAVWNL